MRFSEEMARFPGGEKWVKSCHVSGCHARWLFRSRYYCPSQVYCEGAVGDSEDFQSMTMFMQHAAYIGVQQQIALRVTRRLLNPFLAQIILELSGPNRAKQPRCAMRFESHIPKSLAMRKSFFASDAKTRSLDLKSHENNRKRACENPAMLACDAKNRGVF